MVRGFSLPESRSLSPILVKVFESPSSDNGNPAERNSVHAGSTPAEGFLAYVLSEKTLELKTAIPFP